ncbi:MAG: hypothetical protein EBR70_05920 [Verrucomicrobia bacterium]|nr:hypothetical protein [Verrucomicrobiota bacterium]
MTLISLAWALLRAQSWLLASRIFATSPMSVTRMLWPEGSTSTSFRKAGGKGKSFGPARTVFLPWASIRQTVSKSAVISWPPAKTMPFGSLSPVVKSVTVSPRTRTTLPSPSSRLRVGPMIETKRSPSKPRVTLSGLAPTASLRGRGRAC